MVFAAAIRIGNGAVFVGFEKQDLSDAFVDVDAQRQVGEIGDFDDQSALPAGFERRGVDEQTGARVSRFSDGETGHAARHFEGFDRHAETVMMRRQKVIFRAVFGGSQIRFDQRKAFVEFFRIDFERVNRRENSKAVVGEPHIVAVARTARADYLVAFVFAHEFGQKRRYHLFFFSHPAKPEIGFYGHKKCKIKKESFRNNSLKLSF